MVLKYLYNQSLLPPPNLNTNYNPNSFRPAPIDITDRFGIISTNNFDEIPEPTEMEDIPEVVRDVESQEKEEVVPDITSLW